MPSARQPAPGTAPAFQPADFGIGGLFNMLREAVVVGDAATGRILLWNRGAERMFGWTAEEAVGQLIEILVPPALRPMHRAGLARYEATGEGRYIDHDHALELPALHKDGSELTVELSLTHIVAADRPGRYALAVLRDVSARKRAEVALQEQEARYRLLAEYSSDIIGVYSPQGTCHYVSPAVERVLGYAPDAVVGRSVADFLVPDDRPRAVAFLRRAYQGTGSDSEVLVLRTLRADGGTAWIESTVRTVRDPGTGRVAELIAVSRDVTDRRAAEEALRASEERFRRIFEESPVGMAVVSLEGSVLDANRSLCRMFGYEREEMLGLTIAQLTHPDDLAADLALFREVLQGDIPSYRVEKRYHRKDRSVVWGSLTVALARDAEGRPRHALAIVEDVTERHRAEQERARLAAIVESTDDAILSKSLDGRILTWNPAAERLFGWRAEEVVGGPVQRIVPPDRHGEEDAILARIHRGERIRHYESQRLRKDGTRLDVALTISPILDPRGDIVAASTIMRDITERKRAEADRRMAEARLREVERLQETNRLKTHLLNTASHELNTPLTAIRLQLDLLRTTGVDAMPERQRKAFELFDRNVRRLTELVQDMLDVARLQSGRLTLQRRPTDLAGLAREAAESFQDPASKAGLRLQVDAAGPLRADVDGKRVTQVLYNLLSNALKYTPPGGMVRLEARRLDGSARLTVRDTGIGLTAEQLARLFQPFTQVHAESEEARGGTGLGLFISRGLVEQHGGRIWAESEGAGKGAAFHVELPLATSAADR